MYLLGAKTNDLGLIMNRVGFRQCV